MGMRAPQVEWSCVSQPLLIYSTYFEHLIVLRAEICGSLAQMDDKDQFGHFWVAHLIISEVTRIFFNSECQSKLGNIIILKAK